MQHSAFSPAHITGIFQIHDGYQNPLLSGSKGAGFSIARGVITKVKVEASNKPEYQIRINGKPTQSAFVSIRVLKAFTAMVDRDVFITVEHDVDVPIGSGFGSSGAAALSLALALNEALGTGLSRMKAAQIAHIAEVECRTGLGTVIAEEAGGLEVRLKPGAPGLGEVVNIPVHGSDLAVCLHLGPISTRGLLSRPRFKERVNRSADDLLIQLTLQPSVERFLEASRRFADNLGIITPRVRRVLNETDREGYLCSMAMLGETVYTIARRDEAEALVEIFRRYASFKDDVIVEDIDRDGAKLL